MNATNAAHSQIINGTITAVAGTRRDWTQQSQRTTQWIDKRGSVVRLMGSGSSRPRPASAVNATIAAAQDGVHHAGSPHGF